jgi:hypothetical protein
MWRRVELEEIDWASNSRHWVGPHCRLWVEAISGFAGTWEWHSAGQAEWWVPQQAGRGLDQG